ncbi:MAG: Crp/Fnr family transcriptional regulator [Cyanobacteriota bacterium]|jgi:CRP/FNR family cyclic AMP-dependent transcriptional regulator|nr:Crp/Fnr family transcriptional regulator [Cyanobacteriota bacterium]
MSPGPSLHPRELGEVPLFAGLAEEQQRRLLDNHRLVMLEKDQQLILEQEEAQGLFLLRSGLVKVRCIGQDGEEAVLALLGAGEVCGEMASLSPKGLRSADVVTLTPCSLVVLRGGPFAAMLRSEPGLALALARLQAQRLRDLNKRFGLRGADASTRMLATLADLARKTAPGAPPTAPIPPLPHRELANLSGLARETASRILSTLRRRGELEETEDGGLRLTDLQPLRRRGLLA